MTAQKKAHSKPAPSREDIAKILEKAQQQPGVAEYMEVIRRWQEVQAAAQPHLEAMRPRIVFSASNSSG